MSEIKLPVLLDANNEPPTLASMAAAINATARRCDGCRWWHARDSLVGDCGLHNGEMDADDCCRKGWEPRRHYG